MSGIVGSRFNILGSGLVGSLGTDGQALTSSGAGASAVFEAAPGFDVTSITGATELAEEPAITDELIISDGGTLKRLDVQHILPAPCLAAYSTTTQVIANNTTTTRTWNGVDKQVGGTWANNSRWTPGVAGWYISTWKVRWAASVDSTMQGLVFFKNGAQITNVGYPQNYSYSVSTRGESDVEDQRAIYLDNNDYVECKVYQNTGANSTIMADSSQWLIWRATGVGTSA